MKRKTSGLFVFLCLAWSPLIAQHSDPDRYARAIEHIRDWAREQIDKELYVGISLGFIEGDYMWTDGIGLASIELQSPMTDQSVHRMASISKTMTAFGIMRLVQEGKIHLDDEVQKYVPYFPRKKWPITIRRLLGHQSGISHYKDFSKEADFTRRFTTKEAIAIFKDWDLLFKPGARYSYTTYGYNLLGAIIEGATGQSYGDYMRENVWLPMAMTSTRLDDISDIIPNRVEGYSGPPGHITNCHPVTTSMKYAGGGIVSTVGDLLRFASRLMNDSILKPQWIDSMWTPMMTDSGYLGPYGMGWFIDNDSRYYEVYHSGRQDGTTTFLWLVPSRHLAVAALCNLDDANPWPVCRELAESLIGRPPVLPRIYAAEPINADRLTQLRAAVDAGCAYYDRHRRPLTTDSVRITRGFRYVNQALALTDKTAMRDRIRKGLWPITIQTALCATSYIAAVLSQHFGDDYLWRYHRAGTIQICSDYIDLYRNEKSISKDWRFSPQLEELVKSALPDWQACWTPEVEHIDLANDPITDNMERLLLETFHGHDIRPDLSGALSRRARRELENRNNDEALKIARLDVNMYPQSGEAMTDYGLVQIGAGQTAAGKKLIREALKRSPESVDQSDLNGMAYNFARRGKPEIGREILSVALELFPDIANLYDSQAEMNLMLGDTTKAVALYNKALEIDPKLENSKAMLEKIEGSEK